MIHTGISLGALLLSWRLTYEYLFLIWGEAYWLPETDTLTRGFVALASEVGSLLIEPDRRPFSENLCKSILCLRVWRSLIYGILQ